MDGKRLARTRLVSVFEEDERGEELPSRHYMTHSAGSSDVHYCCTIPGQVRCDCPDYTWQNHPYGDKEEVLCKHLLACLLHEGQEEIIEAAKNIGVR